MTQNVDIAYELYVKKHFLKIIYTQTYTTHTDMSMLVSLYIWQLMELEVFQFYQVLVSS